MITDTGVWTIVINLLAIAFAVRYSHSDTFGQAVIWLLWDFSGLRFVWVKVLPPPEQKPPGYRPPATISVWIFGLLILYFAIYGVASQRYENAVDKIENRMSAFTIQLMIASPEVRKKAYSEIAEIQLMPCPLTPNILKPSTVFLSLVRQDTYDEAVTVLTRIVEKYKEDLEGSQLLSANIKDAVLDGANFRGAYLISTNLQGAQLAGADFQDAMLQEIDLEGTHMEGASFQNAILEDANLMNAYLVGADFEGANLSGANIAGAVLASSNLAGTIGLSLEQLCSTSSVFKARIDRHLEVRLIQDCPERLVKPKSK